MQAISGSYFLPHPARRPARRNAVTISISYGYDAASRLTAITYRRGSTVIGDLAYTYDRAGRTATVSGSWARTNVPTAVSSAVYDDGNELTTWNGTAIAHNAQGDLKNDHNANQYFWNARHQLTEVGNAGGTVKFYYDAFGRRWKKDDHGTVTQYLYSGFNAVQEANGAGTVTANLLGGVETDDLYLRTEGGAPRYLLPDALRSTIALADAAGTITNQYTYEPFGRTTVSNITGTSTNPYQYAGRENDGTGLYYYRARYYHPVFGRFLSADPVGKTPRFPSVSDLYVYTDNLPTTLIDPLGLGPRLPTGEELMAADPAIESVDPIRDLLIAIATFGVGTEAEVLGEGVATFAGEAGADALSLAETATEEVITGVHYTSEEFAALIEESGSLRAGVYVTLPSEVSGMTATEVESTLEIAEGRGAYSVTFDVPVSNLETPMNGPLTSGGATQYQLIDAVPVGKGSFVPTAR
jgi:RHS repeat-associated protein